MEGRRSEMAEMIPRPYCDSCGRSYKIGETVWVFGLMQPGGFSQCDECHLKQRPEDTIFDLRVRYLQRIRETSSDHLDEEEEKMTR